MTKKLEDVEKYFEVQVWNHPPDNDGRLGSFDDMFEFEYYTDAFRKFSQIVMETQEFQHIQLMEYESSSPDSDGDCLAEV